MLFLRSASGDDPVNALWLFDPANREESLVVDPEELLAGADPGDLPAGDHQWPRVRPISSAAMYSADPHDTVGVDPPIRRRSPPVPVTRSEEPDTYATAAPSGLSRGSKASPVEGSSTT